MSSPSQLTTEPIGKRLTDLEVTNLRADFPILDQKMHGKPLAYLDNANSTQKPRAVIDAESHFYAESYAGVHRAVYDLAERATRAYEGGREAVRRLLNAADVHVRAAAEDPPIPGRRELLPRARRRRRRDPDHRDGAPLEPGAVADGVRCARRAPRRRADRRPR
jgi:hypothetical protein